MDDTPSTAGTARRQQFEEDVAKLKLKTSGPSEPRLLGLGVALLVAGLVVSFGAAFASQYQSDSRDVLSAVAFTVFGLGLTIAGAALFVRYSFGRFLRFWLLRLIYEQQPSEDA